MTGNLISYLYIGLYGHHLNRFSFVGIVEEVVAYLIWNHSILALSTVRLFMQSNSILTYETPQLPKCADNPLLALL